MGDNYEYDEQIFGTHFSDADRLGGWGKSDNRDVGEFQGRFNRYETNEEKIMKKIQLDISTLNIKLQSTDFNTIERLIKSDPRIKFKNSLAFLLGYIVVSKNKRINDTDVDEMYKLCDQFVKKLTPNDRVKYVSFISIRKADIIRYASFISKYV